MEEWFLQYRPRNAAALCAVATQGSFDNWCARISEATIDTPPRQAYGELRGLASALWCELRDNPATPLVRPLCQLWWNLEHPIPERAERLEPIVPDLSAEESARRIAILDRGRANFARLLLAAFGEGGALRTIGVRNLVIRWARIQYECVHGFQAPPTPDPARAARDAMGLTDHFAELMHAILTRVDGKEPDVL